MIVHAENWRGLVAHALVRVIVQVQVRYFDIARRQRFGIYTETVILRGDFNLIGQKIFDRMIRTVMAKFQFEGLATQGQPANLMAETDSEHGNLTDELANVLDR